jgi:hypothetical protein
MSGPRPDAIALWRTGALHTGSSAGSRAKSMSCSNTHVPCKFTTAPLARGTLDFLERKRISRYVNLCQICARELLIWTF